METKKDDHIPFFVEKREKKGRISFGTQCIYFMRKMNLYFLSFTFELKILERSLVGIPRRMAMLSVK